MYTPTAMVRPPQPHLYSFRITGDVCVRFLEGERLCAVPPSSYPVFCPSTAGQRGL